MVFEFGYNDPAVQSAVIQAVGCGGPGRLDSHRGGIS